MFRSEEVGAVLQDRQGNARTAEQDRRHHAAGIAGLLQLEIGTWPGNPRPLALMGTGCRKAVYVPGAPQTGERNVIHAQTGHRSRAGSARHRHRDVRGGEPRIVAISFDPFDTRNPALVLQAPLYGLIFVLVGVGIVAGGIAAWLKQHKWRARARRAEAEARELRARLDAAEPRRSVPAPRDAAPPFIVPPAA